MRKIHILLVASFTSFALAVAFGLSFPTSAVAAELFQAKLSGDDEVPSVTTNTDGHATALVNNAETAIDVTLRVNDGVRVTQAHFHCAPEGVNGPVTAFVAGLHARGWDIDGKWISNQTLTAANVMPVSTADCSIANGSLSDLLDAMRAGIIYVNVHTLANSGGEVRGQLK